MVDPILTERFKEHCRACVAEHFDYELDLFDPIWEALVHGDKELDLPLKYRASGTKVGALDTDSGLFIACFMAACAKINREVDIDDFSPSVAERYFRDEMAQHNLSGHLLDVCKDSGPTLLHDVLEASMKDRRDPYRKEPAPPSTRRKGYYWVSRLTREVEGGGLEVESKWWPCQKALEEAKSSEYDVVVNEPEEEVAVRKKRTLKKAIPHSIDALHMHRRSMLWLMMSRVGGEIDFRKERVIIHEKDSQQAKKFYKRAHHPLQQKVSTFLGPDLYERWLGPGERFVYPVKASEVSFLWVRRDKESLCSTLLRGTNGYRPPSYE